METVDIKVCAGVSFKVLRSNYLQAHADADRTGLNHFIGVFSNGFEAIGTSRDALLELGAQAVAWVFPHSEVTL